MGQNKVRVAGGYWVDAAGDSSGNAQVSQATQLAGEDLTNNHLVTHPPAITGWAYHVPAVDTVATITLAAAAAGSGIKHVVTSIQASVTAGAAAPTAAVPAVLTLTDGATAKWSRGVGVPTVAGAANEVNIEGLWIVGTAETAMTLAFAAKAGGNTFECVSFTYVDIT